MSPSILRLLSKGKEVSSSSDKEHDFQVPVSKRQNASTTRYQEKELEN